MPRRGVSRPPGPRPAGHERKDRGRCPSRRRAAASARPRQGGRGTSTSRSSTRPSSRPTSRPTTRSSRSSPPTRRRSRPPRPSSSPTSRRSTTRRRAPRAPTAALSSAQNQLSKDQQTEQTACVVPAVGRPASPHQAQVATDQQACQRRRAPPPQSSSNSTSIQKTLAADSYAVSQAQSQLQTDQATQSKYQSAVTSDQNALKSDASRSSPTSWAWPRTGPRSRTPRTASSRARSRTPRRSRAPTPGSPDRPAADLVGAARVQTAKHANVTQQESSRRAGPGQPHHRPADAQPDDAHCTGLGHRHRRQRRRRRA